MEQNRHLLVSFEQFLAERQMRSIEHQAGPPPPPAVVLPPPPPPELFKPVPADPTPQCLICCTQLPKEKDPKYTAKVIKPCRSCNSAYCTSCIRKMFIDACNDLTRMPPRCCVQINLHHARPLLTKEEAALFRAKYEEWSTPHPMYCPVPVCSAFIPERLLPHQMRTKGKQRADSGIGTPTATTYACPTCTADICLACRQIAHPNINCEIHEFGIDAETAALLKSWGYKKCPKCGHGLKRMFGCDHMECRCGAHFCWGCLKMSCDQTCYNDDEETYDSDAEPDDPDDNDPQTGLIDDAAVGAENITATTVEEAVQLEPTAAVETTTAPQAIPRPQNLDGGSARYWERMDLDFGEEPSNDYQDRAWDCHHLFSPHKVSFASALNNSHATDMECVKCWSIVHPELELPTHLHADGKGKIVPASIGRPQGVGATRGSDRRRRYALPRGLFRADATIGTAPHLTAPISLLSQSMPVRESWLMEDVQFAERVADTYGNVITATPIDLRRRVSLDEGLDAIIHGAASAGQLPLRTPALTVKDRSDVFPTVPSTFSLAHECRYCNLLVCNKCKTDVLAAQEPSERQEDQEFDEESTITVQGTNETQESQDSDEDDDEQPPPSLFN